MVWTDPRTYNVGEIVTAAKLNETRDSLRALGDAWPSYTPEWSAATTNPTLDDGQLYGRYRAIGKTLDFRIELTYGASTDPGSGQWRFTLPPGCTARIGATAQFADCVARTGAPSYFIMGLISTSALNRIALLTMPTTAGDPYRSVNGTAPFTWAAGHTLSISGTVEVI